MGSGFGISLTINVCEDDWEETGAGFQVIATGPDVLLKGC
jgi:hypothetical protein